MAIDARIPLSGNGGKIDASPLTNMLLQYGQQKRQDELRPLQNQLLETQIAGAKQTQANSDSELKLKAAQFQNQAFRALKSIPDPQLRQMAYQSFVEHGKQIGVHDGNPDDDISDNGLEAGIKATDAFMPQQKTDMKYGTTPVPMVNPKTGQSTVGQMYQGRPGVFASDGSVLGSDWIMAASPTAQLNQQGATDRLLMQPTIAGQKQQAVSNIDLQMKPKIGAAETTAQKTAEAAVNRESTIRSNTVALSVYETGMGNLMKSLGDTSTGPIIGRLPALTANQQIAEGSKAVMAPVLKQMFRASGEGVFTDKDQEMLMGMLPTRQDHPEAAKAKMAAIDSIVRAKLQTPQPVTEPGDKPAPAPQQGGGVVGSHPQYGDVTEEDIQATMKANNMTREQVLQRLGGQ